MRKLESNIIKSNLVIYTPLSPAITTEVYDSYWKFATLRQEAFFNRVEERAYPWSADPILNQYKFTNAYRAADRVSQYLIKNVIYNKDLPDSPKEVLFRILLFKLFNKIDTWELLTKHFGPLTFEDYNFQHFDRALNAVITGGQRIYSAAYIMPSGQSYFGFERKHSNHLKLIELIMNNETEDRLMGVKTMQKAFEILKGFPGFGDFLAYQLLIDINYSPILDFSESEFVVPGPGAKGGISKCFENTAGLSHVEIIKFVTDRQESEFERLGLSFKNLWGRPLQLIDCQNLFCEVDKYARVRHPNIKGDSDRVKIKQMFKPNNSKINFWFPPKWDINKNIVGLQDVGKLKPIL
ncbi:nucleotide kinase domain-containing protein [Mucilaginibacter sp. SJ]|uniref:nucleotide kinase domain-containing protein n=1 Tax=Mucilaginibacter sp. SJ TaxID=3029053 RepID=UPI0023A9DF09|nr:nucleotide kinase domain-containing protein [Mucilaginibacter sp. SJ]WDZ99691.1 putative DNA base hypermodification protein [Mucilaginibacter sp. SJ]